VLRHVELAARLHRRRVLRHAGLAARLHPRSPNARDRGHPRRGLTSSSGPGPPAFSTSLPFPVSPFTHNTSALAPALSLPKGPDSGTSELTVFPIYSIETKRRLPGRTVELRGLPPFAREEAKDGPPSFASY
jgi:hypothetical protein